MCIFLPLLLLLQHLMRKLFRYIFGFFCFSFFFFFGMHFGQLNIFLRPLRWPEPIYMRDGYVFETRFSAGKIGPISMILGILNKVWSNSKKLLFIFLKVLKRLRYRHMCKTTFLQKISIISKPYDRFFSNFSK